MMLRLPAVTRAAVAVKYFRPFTQSSQRLRWPNSLGACGRDHEVLTRSVQLRNYATVHVDGTHEFWSQYGKTPAPEAADNLHRDVGASEGPKPDSNGEGAHSQGPSAAVEPTEQEQLLDVLRRKANRKPLVARRALRQRMKEALSDSDSVSALRSLAQGHPQTVQVKDATSNTTPDVSDASDSKIPQLIDVKRIQDTKPLPTEDQYPGAPEVLFDPKLASSAIYNACAILKISMQIETDFHPKEGLSRKDLNSLSRGLREVQVCTLNVEIPDVCQEQGEGEGINKASAKQAAWLHLLSKMHTSGSLKEIFPDPNLMKMVHVTEQQMPELAEVDQKTMAEEKNAKMQIYDYAASLGLVPEFDTTIVQPRSPRARLGRKQKQPNPLFRMNIRLDERGIKVSATANELSTAEVAAALAFKQEAEKQHHDIEHDAHSPSQKPFSVLSVDTAKDFFEYSRHRGDPMNVELEFEPVTLGGKNMNSARVTVDGEPAGKPVVMLTKKQAESCAYLTAAIEIAKGDPQMLHNFEQTLKKGKGKLLRPLQAMDLQVDFGALQAMRNGLLEARDAGLPDSRQTLTAEVTDMDTRYRRQQRRLSAHELVSFSTSLLAEKGQFEADPALEDLRSKKAALPMNHHREDVLKMVSDNQYCIVVGATGSGKTTQVPQILFDDAIRRDSGSSCNIICTQPRRIAATSVAQRVAVERNERLQKSVGYQVRFDAKLPREPFGITYCTTGILQEKLKNDPEGVLDSLSHILIDEVHERDLNIDFLMIVLKKAIKMRQCEGKSVPKVILMSATLDTELFANYFRQPDSNGESQPCPALSVPGRTFPVKEKYLGTIMHELFEKNGPEVRQLLAEDSKSDVFLNVETAFSKSQSESSSGLPVDSVIDWKRERQRVFDSDEETGVAREKEEALVPTSLLAATIAHICATTDDGAILAFVPGLEEIVQTQRILEQRRPFALNFNNRTEFKICPLHSTLSKEQQSAIFESTSLGCRKIILSTNIAETSVTVTDVKYVIDTGKLREKRYDQVRRITKLQCVWESKSNSKQRAGRAGRVQDGFYYALFSKERSNSLRAIGLPELLRTDLQETCLSIKAQKFDEPVASFLAQAIEPPSKQAVHMAIDNLKAIEAYTVDERLTALGRVLSQLPVHPMLGKMILLGIVFRCLDPMILIGASAEERALFLKPLGNRAEADRAHRAYAGGSQSDHIAFLEAFKELRLLRDQYGMDAMARRAHENFLHTGAFRSIDQTAKQIEQILIDSRLIPIPEDGRREGSECGPADLNRNAANTELVKCLLLAGFHPNLATKLSSVGMSYRTPSEQAAIMHPSSLNAELKRTEKHPRSSLFAFSTLARSNDGNSLFLRDSTSVSPLMAVLFGGHLRMTSHARLEMDEWLPFFVKSRDSRFSTKLILEFRKALDRVLLGAFSSLADLRSENGDTFAQDPIREQFASRLVEVLDRASGRSLQDPWAHRFRM